MRLRSEHAVYDFRFADNVVSLELLEITGLRPEEDFVVSVWDPTTGVDAKHQAAVGDVFCFDFNRPIDEAKVLAIFRKNGLVPEGSP